jgi:photosynthetic reaction center H subunit
LTEKLDVALVAINLFFLFFIFLVAYLHREGKREGYPLVSDGETMTNPGWFGTPQVKTFRLADGTTMSAPHARDMNPAPLKAETMKGGPGSPIMPTGNPMLDSIGPGSYTNRRDIPDVTWEGHPRIAPMRAASNFSIAEGDPDLRGFKVLGADGVQGGTVRDLWVDRSESTIRYAEIDVAGGSGSALVPILFVDMDKASRTMSVPALLGGQFAAIPRLKSADRVTFLEEEKIVGYFGGGTLYAEPSRQEPCV